MNHPFSLRNQSFQFCPEKAVYWENQKTVIVSDLHWGKPEVFQQHGIPVSSDLLSQELSRLSRVCEINKTERLLVLGDLIHSIAGMSDNVLSELSSWFSKRSFEVILIEGNHDARFQSPKEWGLEQIRGVWEDSGIAFSHDEKAYSGAFTWSGHLHPTVVLNQGGDQLRLPCFVLDMTYGILPAFSDFTRGVKFYPEENGPSLFAVTDDQVIEVSHHKKTGLFSERPVVTL